MTFAARIVASPLERAAAARLLWGVRAQPFFSSAVVGSVATAATTGALVAMGHRLGSASLPFAAIGGVLFGRSAGAGTVVAGVVGHVAAMVLWSVLFVRLAERLRSRDALSAGIIAAAQFVVGWIIAWMSGRGLSSALLLGDRIAFALVLGGALVVGMRFAFSLSRNA
ncbi:MAG: hypothetical protein ABJF01_14475 [bacterium]